MVEVEPTVWNFAPSRAFSPVLPTKLKELKSKRQKPCYETPNNHEFVNVPEIWKN